MAQYLAWWVCNIQRLHGAFPKEFCLSLVVSQIHSVQTKPCNASEVKIQCTQQKLDSIQVTYFKLIKKSKYNSLVIQPKYNLVYKSIHSGNDICHMLIIFSIYVIKLPLQTVLQNLTIVRKFTIVLQCNSKCRIALQHDCKTK